MKDNLKLWDKVEQTDPQYTSKVQGKAFNGTSINPMYLTKKATEHFGPIGEGWGVESLCHETETIGDTIMFSEQVLLWYMKDGKRCELSQWSTIKVAYNTKGKNSYLFVDEEARKKCRTNATGKCLSLLGFSADIWLKYYDSPEYVNQMKVEHERINVAKENMTKYRELIQKLDINCGCNTDEEKLLVCQWVLDNAGIDHGYLKVQPHEAKKRLADELKNGVDPKTMLKKAQEWINGDKAKEEDS